MDISLTIATSFLHPPQPTLSSYNQCSSRRLCKWWLNGHWRRVTIQSSTYWFSHIWDKEDLQTFLPITKVLQRYITSWEALAQLCIILTVFQQCETRPGIINIQSGSDNTGAEANINHGFSTTEILADIIKLVSLKQIQCNSILNIHHIPGEKNIDADNLSRGRASDFSDKLRVVFSFNDIFDRTPFPNYINNLVQWDSEIHPLAKLAFFPLFLLFLFFLFWVWWSVACAFDGCFTKPTCYRSLFVFGLNEAHYRCEKISQSNYTVYTSTEWYRRRFYFSIRLVAITLTECRRSWSPIDFTYSNSGMSNHDISTTSLWNTTSYSGKTQFLFQICSSTTTIFPTKVQTTETSLWGPSTSKPPLLYVITHQWGGPYGYWHPTISSSYSKIIALTCYIS